MTALCSDCWEQWLEWCDYRPPRLVKIAQIGDPRWNVPDSVRINETVASQQELIAEICARRHSQGQLALFEVAA